MIKLGSKRIRLRVSKKTRFISHMLALVAFIALFVWGWDLQVSDAIAYLIISIVFLVAIVITSVVFGWLLRIVQSKRDRPVDELIDQQAEDESTTHEKK